MMLFMCGMAVAHASGYIMALTPVDASSYIVDSLATTPIIVWQYGYEFAFIALGIAIGVTGGLLLTMALHCCTCWPIWAAKLPFRIIHMIYVTICGVASILCRSKVHDEHHAAGVDDDGNADDKQHADQTLPSLDATPYHSTTMIQARADELNLLTNHVLTSLLMEFNINAGKPNKELMVFALSRCQIATGKQLKYMRHIARKQQLVIPVQAMTSISTATEWITSHQ